VVNFSKS